MRLLPRALILLALGAGPMGCGEVAGPEKPISGKRIYDRHCARCHGSDGKGVAGMTVPDLTVRPRMEALGDEGIKRAIMQGRPPGMPAFGGQFVEPSHKVLVAYVRSLSDPRIAGATQPGAAPDGEAPK